MILRALIGVTLLSPLISFASIIDPSDCQALLRSNSSQLHITTEPPRFVARKKSSSKGQTDVDLERARELSIYEDFKWISDLQPKYMTKAQRQRREKRLAQLKAAANENDWIKEYVRTFYSSSLELKPAPASLTKKQFRLKGLSPHQSTFSGIEEAWQVLARQTPARTSSSLIPVPYPILIPGSRFQESYYWDSYFAMSALLKTGRIELVRMQVENFLYLIDNYSIIPNGLRDYYLGRSQPPVISEMIRRLLEEEMKLRPRKAQALQWLKQRALPLLVSDYENFWMNSETRLNLDTGLNHHFDHFNTPRPERFSLDDEEELGVTFRDVRAEAESGKDFTLAFEKEATQVAPVLLNSIMYQYEKNLSYFHQLLGDRVGQEKYERFANIRKQRMFLLLWDSDSGVFRDYHFTRGPLPALTADSYAPLWTGVATQAQATQMVETLSVLDRKGGVVASDIYSGHQWDAPYGWAPHQYMAVEGLNRYGYEEKAHQIASRWVKMIDDNFEKQGQLLEKMDVESASAPKETGKKYKTQTGFLWTNGVYVHLILKYLGAELEPIAGI